MAKKAQLVSLPAPPKPVAEASPAGSPLPGAPGQMPPTETVADAFALGNLCMHQGRYPEAIAAYQKAVKGDPTFGEAWNNLAIAYQNLGEDEKAIEAFRKYKTVALP